MAIEQADQFLAACVRAALTDHNAPPWPSALATADHHEILLHRASFHGVCVLLCEAPEVLAHWPASLVESLRQEMRLAGLWEQLHHKAIAEIIERLAANGIASLVLKGTALAYLVYDEPAVRRRGDTDLLIHPRDLARTRALLEAAGCYRRDDPYGLHYQETWLVDCGAQLEHSIDLHWEPSDRPMIQKILKADRFWERRVPLPRLSPAASAPDSISMLVHGAVNQAWHLARGYYDDDTRITGGRRLIWAVDYLRLTERLSPGEWQELGDFCVAHDAAAIVFAALDGAQRDIGLAVPDAVMAQLRAAAPTSPAYTYINDPDMLRNFRKDFWTASSLGTRLRLVWGMAFAPRSHLLRKYPDCAQWPTALLQLRRYSEALPGLRKQGHAA